MSERFHLTKTIRRYERMNFEFGFVAINPFNRHGPSWVTTKVSSPEFGQLKASGGGRRVMQLEGRVQW